MKQRYCPRCNTPLSARAAFCTNCGIQADTRKNKSNRKTAGIIFISLFLVLIIGIAAVFLTDDSTIPSMFKNRASVPSIHDQFINTMSSMKESGDNYTKSGMTLQAEYCYGIAGSSISAYRFAIDNLIYLKGDQEDLSEITGDAYANWDTIAAINYASPYPYYFEGLIHHIEGDERAAEVCYTYALTNPSFPEKGLSFYYLEDLSKEELFELKAKLSSLEESIYSSYTPDISACERDPMNFSDEYLRALAKEYMERDTPDYGIAKQYYITALSVNPFEPKNFACLALLAIYTEDIDSAFYYTNEGLWIDEDDKALNRIKELLEKAGESHD